MGILSWFKPEVRQRPDVTFTPARNSSFLEILGYGNADTPSISHEQALGVPAVWCAINFLAGTVAGLPLRVYEEDANGRRTPVRRTAANPIVDILQNQINQEDTTFQWLFDAMVDILTDGRSTTYIERDRLGRVTNLFPLEEPSVERRPDGSRWYRQGSKGTNVYPASDVIDLTFLRKDDRISARSPLTQCAIALSKAYHANAYGAKTFASGGIPPMVLSGPIVSGDAAKRASADVAKATQQLANERKSILAMPDGHKLEPVGHDPSKMQLLDAQEFAVQEIARIFGIPPNFLHDLSRATYSNVEETSLNLVRYTLRRWTEMIEAELRLKLFPRGSARFAEFDLDKIARGDMMSRVAANAQAINTGQQTVNEIREKDSLAPVPGGDTPLVQGAMTSLDNAINPPDPAPAPVEDIPNDE